MWHYGVRAWIQVPTEISRWLRIRNAVLEAVLDGLDVHTDVAANLVKDAVVARQYQTNLHIFKQTAQHWAAVYGGGSYQVGSNHLESQHSASGTAGVC